MSLSAQTIDDLPPLREVISAHGLRAEKALGQNFLLDQNITDKIARHIAGLERLNVAEIGPGPGGLTRSLLRGGAQKVLAVEFDGRAIEALQSLQDASDGRLTLYQADALEVDLIAQLPAPRAIAANLPYNIATPLLIGWLKQIREVPDAYESMTLMFQKEVGQRIAAQPGSKAYGRLSVMSQWLCDVKSLFDLPPSAFTPAPKIHSSVVRFIPKSCAVDDPAFALMEDVLAKAFGQRRKMLRSALKDYAQYFDVAGIDPTLRAEDLNVEDYVRLVKAIEA